MDSKENKYDRQIRIWGEHGQLLLETSRVCLLQGNAMGAEILKNLILPGIGSYVIVDDGFVTKKEAETTFFLDVNRISETKAQQMCEFLQELNKDVKGEYLISTLESILEHNPNFFKQFNIVITSALNDKLLLKLEKILWGLKIPLIIAYSVGFIGYIRITMPEHTIIETHADNLEDLRIDCPWPELKALASNFKLENPENHSIQIPYILILLNCIDIWKIKSPKTLPYTYEEKEQFKQIIRSYMHEFDEEKIQEVLSVAWKASCVTSIPDDVQCILRDNKCIHISSESSEFWILCHALSNYVLSEGNGLLPLPGILPDMKSDSEIYVKLRNTYHQKAQKDYEYVRKHVQNILTSINQPISKISDKKIKFFCKQSKYIKLLHYRSLELEYKYPNSELIKSSFSIPDDLITWYIALRCYNKFRNTFGKYAGSEQATLDKDINQYIQLTKQFLSKFNCNITDFQIIACKELVKTRGNELNNIISFIGGVAAQEAIKEYIKNYLQIK
ncbi:hypothetical protein PMAC_000502 [Pneumocystis sp. 'macacae']|nr:hypothetical protein PMAC_000502 [Pneumocystis sp. 'macacae']